MTSAARGRGVGAQW